MNSLLMTKIYYTQLKKEKCTTKVSLSATVFGNFSK